MALIEDLNIKIKDKNANSTDYEDIRQIRVPRSDGGYGLYTNLHSIRSYFMKYTGEGSKFEVLANANFSAGGFSGAKAMTVFIDNDGSEWNDDFSYVISEGKRRCSVLLSPYSFKIGDIVDTSTL